MITLDAYFGEHTDSKQLYQAVLAAVLEIGPTEVKVTRSQVAFYREKAFAWVWMPEQYLRRKAAPLVLTIGFCYRPHSSRWKSIVEPAPGRFTHHLELYSVTDIDENVKGWLRSTWESAGPGKG